MPDLTLWIALSLTEHVGSKTLSALIEHFGDDPQAILGASAEQLQQVHGIGPKIARSILTIDLAQFEQALAAWESTDLSITTFACPDAIYPPRLLQIDDPPATLFMRGLWQADDDRAVAVVGTREPSPQAAAIAGQIAARMAEAGYTIISGLALGIDAAAHEGALSIAGGRTIAVLGCGLLNIYPQANHTLALRCVQRGALISEVHPNATPSAPRLVARNRIISGLSRALIVVETDADGGAMHAARFAQTQGRPVYVVDLDASGNRALLTNGARPIDPHLHDLDNVLHDLARM